MPGLFLRVDGVGGAVLVRQPLAEQLESGVLITYNGEGHTVYGNGVSCIDDLVDDYFVKGVVPDSDPNC